MDYFSLKEAVVRQIIRVEKVAVLYKSKEEGYLPEGTRARGLQIEPTLHFAKITRS